jgi:nucleotide-binding universal stress UspA family protein
MSTQSLIGLIEQCLDARALLEEKRQHGEAVGPALERARRASTDLAALAARIEASASESAIRPSVTPLLHAVRNYLAAEAVIEGRGGEAASPAQAFENLFHARRTLMTQLRAYHLVEGISESPPSDPAATSHSPGGRVLIAIDGSTQSTWAVQFGGFLADALDAQVMLLHVHEPTAVQGIEIVFAPAQVREQHHDVHVHWRYLVHQARRALPSNVRAESRLRWGLPAAEIVHVARTWEANLIVMGTRGRGRLTQFLLGSVAEAVVRAAPCPVVTIGHEPAARATAAAKE